MVAAVRDDPARRLELAGRFYDRRAGRPGIRSYRRAEMAFMRWQISRGVLAAPDAEQPGSPWWRAVNEGLLRDACQADLLAGGRPGTASRPSVECWIRFLRQPSAQAWYRAHNASIVAGYLAHRDLSERELPLERFFMDVALIRVLYAHSLLTAPRVALGRFAPRGGCSPIRAGAAPTPSCPCTTSCRSGIRSTGSPCRRSWPPRTTGDAWSITA